MHVLLSYRHSLFGGNSIKTLDADLSRLYTATSLMQIDDNIMRYLWGNGLRSHVVKSLYFVVQCRSMCFWNVFVFYLSLF